MYLTLFILLCISLVLGLCLHVLIMRKMQGKYAYITAFLALNAALFMVLGIFLFTSESRLSVEGILISVGFVESFFLVYCLVLVGVVNDSPTLAITKAIIASEPQGLSPAALQSFIKAHPFIDSRLDALSATGDIKLTQDHVTLTRRSILILRLLSFYQHLLKGHRERG